MINETSKNKCEANKKNDLFFCETQRYPWYIALFFICLMMFPIFLISMVSYAKICGLASIMLIPLIGITAIYATLLVISRLKTEVRYDGLYVRFFPIHMSYKRYQTADITEYGVKTFDSLDFGKIRLGIRYNYFKKTWGYITHGNKGVLLILKDGKKLFIGSQKPEELAKSLDLITGKANHL